MTSTYSTRNRLNLQAPGDNLNLWGAILNSAVFQLLEDAKDGRLALTVSGPVTLTSVNGATDQARMAFLDCTGTGGAVTIPAVEKIYLVRNASSGAIVFTTGGTTNATLQAGQMGWIVSDAVNVRAVIQSDFAGAVLTSLGYPVHDTDAATMRYVLDQAFAASSATFPGQPGNQNRFLGSNGTNAAWMDPLPSMPGKAGQFLGNNGTDRTGAFWDYPGFRGRQGAKTGAYTIAFTDRETLIPLNGGAPTLPAAASVDSRFSVYLQNIGTAQAIAPTGGDTIDALSGYTIYPGEVRLFTSDGVSAWTSVVLVPFHAIFAASGAFVYPPGYSGFSGTGFGGGGGGGGTNSGSSVFVGGGGGGAGAIPFYIPASEIVFGASENFTVGAGGAGGLGVSGGGGSGLGGVGGSSSIGSRRTFVGGSAATAGSGGVGSGLGPTSTTPNGFGGSSSAGGVTAAYGGGAGANSNANGGASTFGAGGGGASDPAAGTTHTGGTSVTAGAGGTSGAIGIAGSTGSAPGGGGGGAGRSSGTDWNGGQGARGEIRIAGVL